MSEAAAKIPCWLPSREVVARIARHLGYPIENARLRIVRYVKARRIQMRGRNAGLLVYATGYGPIDWGDESIELCLDDLIEAGLLPAPGRPEELVEQVRQPADRAIAYLIMGYLVEWGDWTPEMIRERERGEIDLGQVISEGVPAWGWHPIEQRRKRIPSDHFRAETIERKQVLPVSVAHQPKVVVRIDGTVGVSPPQRSADYKGPPWSSIEIDSAALRQARPRPAEPEPALPSTLAVSEPAQSSLEVPAPVSPPPQEPTPILKWDPQSEWSVERAMQELGISESHRKQKAIAEAVSQLPQQKRYRAKSIPEILDTISAADLYRAIGLSSPDSCERFLNAWKAWRANSAS